MISLGATSDVIISTQSLKRDNWDLHSLTVVYYTTTTPPASKAVSTMKTAILADPSRISPYRLSLIQIIANCFDNGIVRFFTSFQCDNLTIFILV